MPHDPAETEVAVYVVTGGLHRLIAETSWQGLGPTLRQLHEDGEFDGDGITVGVFDQTNRVWTVNPWKGRGPAHV